MVGKRELLLNALIKERSETEKLQVVISVSETKNGPIVKYPPGSTCPVWQISPHWKNALVGQSNQEEVVKHCSNSCGEGRGTRHAVGHGRHKPSSQQSYQAIAH